MKNRVICLLLAFVLLLGLLPAVSLHAAAASTDIPTLRSSDQLVAVLKRMEGFLQYPVWDYNQWSVGYGSRCPDDKLAEYQKNGIPESDATVLLQNFLTSFENAVNAFARKYGLRFTQNQFDALISFTYNCGSGWTNDNESFLQNAIRSNADAHNIIYGMVLWCKAGGTSLLAKRRLCEANMYLYGVYKAYNDNNSLPDNLRYIYLDGNGGTVRYDTHGFDTLNPQPVICEFSSYPIGVDDQGNTFVYELAGWYTEKVGGRKVEVLDSSLALAGRIYAQWRDPNTGEIVDVTNVQTPSEPTGYKTGVVNAWDVNCRAGAGVGYAVVGKKNTGDRVRIYDTANVDNLTWGRMEDGSWIAMKYVTLDNGATQLVEPNLLATKLELLRAPNKTEYLLNDMLLLDGSVLKITYSDGTVWAKSITREMAGSDVLTLIGDHTVTVNYKGKSLKFPVSIKAQVDFIDYDGTVLQSQLYGKDEAVVPPANPTRPDDEFYRYEFTGWDSEVVPCTGHKVYTAVYEQIYHEEPSDSIVITSLPLKTEYQQRVEELDLTGAKITAYQKNGEIVEYNVHPKMVSGFDNTADGEITITVQYGGASTTFTVIIVKPLVTFVNYDGSLISQGYYEYGQEIQVPANPTRPSDEAGDYDFAGWDKEVVPCNGSTTYTATYTLRYPAGDVDRNNKVDEADAIYLLWHTFFPKDYPVYVSVDYNKDGIENENDAIYLLWHVFFAADYPL